MENEVRRDRSVMAMLEVCLAGLLIAAFILPWYQLGGRDVEGSLGQSGITLEVFLPWFLIPFGAATAVVATLVGFALPSRGVVAVSLVAFDAAGIGAGLRLLDIATGDWSMQLQPVGPGRGLWLFAVAAAVGIALATLDLVRGGSSTFVWRALGEPSTRRTGLFLAWLAGLAITLGVGVFPMFPRWWLIGFVALLVAPPGARLLSRDRRQRRARAERTSA